MAAANCLFERAYHQRIAQVLCALDGHALAAKGCLFGGGTAIVLRHGEYRESVDIDLLVSHLSGYRQLREWLTSSVGFAPVLRPGHTLTLARELRADQYGIRTLLRVDEALIKFEVVLEARITLAAPTAQDQICGIPTLTSLDMVCTKLLALADRWRDDAVASRDLIDLAMLQPRRPLFLAAMRKAHAAYGDAPSECLLHALADWQARPLRLAQCMQALGMEAVPRALVWQRASTLARWAKSKGLTPTPPRP